MFEPLLNRLEPFAREFSQRGKALYLVGGAVRNLLLGREVVDFDFTTDAHPEEVQTFFKKVLPTGLQHGTVTVLFRGEAFEVTTFRVDGNYSDGRRPDQVTFTPSLDEDLKRRDFTINAMALDLATGALVDPHDGQGDLRRQILRAIGEPGQRFDEDALRLLRLYRFSSQLGFSIDPATQAAVAPRRARLASVSRERVREELVKALAGSHPENAWEPLATLGFLTDLFAPLNPRPLNPLELQKLGTLRRTLRLSYWLTLTTKLAPDDWERALRRLTFSNAEIASALGPAKAWPWLQGTDLGVGAKGIIEAWGHRDRVAAGVEYLRALEAVGYWKDAEGWCGEMERVAGSNEAVFQSELAINGRDLLEAGVRPGPDVGRVLKALQREVWKHPEANQASTLRSMVSLP